MKVGEPDLRGTVGLTADSYVKISAGLESGLRLWACEGTHNNGKLETACGLTPNPCPYLENSRSSLNFGTKFDHSDLLL